MSVIVQEQVEFMVDEIASLEFQLAQEEKTTEMLVIERDDFAQKIHDAYEVYANMDGDDFRSVTALTRVIKNIVAELKP